MPLLCGLSPGDWYQVWHASSAAQAYHGPHASVSWALRVQRTHELDGLLSGSVREDVDFVFMVLHVLWNR